MSYRTIRTLPVICMLLITTFIAIVGPSPAQASNGPLIEGRLMIDHPPIAITSDPDFAAQASTESWAGSGTDDDPYVIQGYLINASSANYGISISGTTVHFIVRSCHIFDASMDHPYGSGTGMRFYNAENGHVRYCQFFRNYHAGMSIFDCSNISMDNVTVKGPSLNTGIHISLSEDVSITACTITDADTGIHLEESTGLVKGCRVQNSTYNGIEMYRCSGWKFDDNHIVDSGSIGVYIRSGCLNNEFHRNTFVNCSFGIYGDKEVFTTNHIPTDNTVNGLAVHQIRDHAGSGEELSLSSGQLLLGNVSDVVVRGMEIYRASEAMVLGHCSMVKVMDCDLSNNERGMEVVGGDNITIEDCIFMDCDRAGVVMEETVDGAVSDCFFKGCEMGLMAGDSLIGLNTNGNHMEKCDIGIYLGGALDAVVTNNTVMGSEMYGIYLEHVFGSVIDGNRITFDDTSLSSRVGIGANYIDGPIIRDNLIKDATRGLHFERAFDTEVTNNTIDSSVNEGAVIDGSDSCVVRGNLFYRSGGLGLSFISDEGPTMDNLIWGNSFLFNNGATTVYQSGRYQARDSAPSDNWTSAADGKGNHWSDWTTPDIDGDGIVDLPYALEGGRHDTRPLVLDPLLHLTPPTYVQAVTSMDSVNISWQGPSFTRSGQISGYRVFRALGDGPYQLLIELPSEARSYDDLGVESGILYNYSVLAYNRYGPGLMSASVEARPDSTPPELMISTPVNGSFWNVSSILASWESSDNVGVAGHRYRLDEHNWTDVGNNTTVPLTNLSEGDHLLEVECWDGLDNTVYRNVTFHTDLTAPQIDILEPSDGLITSSTTMTVVWVAEDLPYSDLSFGWRLDGGTWRTTNGTSVIIEDLTDGVRTIEVRAFDRAGNVGLGSINFTVDTVSPTVDITNPTEGGEFRMRPITASWEYNGTGSRVIGVRSKLDSGPWRELGLASNETLVGLETGNHTYWVSVTDGAGNTGTAFVSFKVVGDIPEPPGPGKGLVMGRVLDSDGEPLHKVKVRSDTGEETFTDSEGYFYLEVPSGRRTLSFSKKGYETYERIMEVPENSTMDMGNFTVVNRPVEGEDGWKAWQYCLFCCLLPAVVMVLLFITIGAIARIRRSSRRRLDEE